MTKKLLTTFDEGIIENFEQSYGVVIDLIEKVKQFQVGDYLILYVTRYEGESMAIRKNSYGAPIKYKVVYCTKHGVPFVKRVNKRGKPIGDVSSCVGTLHTDDFKSYDSQKFEFVLDPDYADSILLQDEYDPANLHRSKKDIWKAVTDHNKSCKVKTHNLKDVTTFFNTVNIGDTLWMSNVSHVLVQDKKIMSPKDFNQQVKRKDKTGLRSPLIPILTIRDKNSNIKDITPDFFCTKALYKERPRTYKELNI